MKVVRARKKVAAFANVSKGIGFVEIIKVTGWEEAPGPRMRRALLGETWRWIGDFNPPRYNIRCSVVISGSPVPCGRVIRHNAGELEVGRRPGTAGPGGNWLRVGIPSG